MSRLRLLAPLLLALPLFLLAAPAPAIAASAAAPVEITDSVLLARGAAVRLELTGTCDAGESAQFVAVVTQRAGGRIAQGAGNSTSFACTGGPQQATILVVANVSGTPFRVGEALASVSLRWGCCTSVDTQEVVRIHR